MITIQILNEINNLIHFISTDIDKTILEYEKFLRDETILFCPPKFNHN